MTSIAREMVEHELGVPLGDNLDGIHFVRNVAPNKDMFRVSFYLTEQILCTTEKKLPPIKRAAAAADCSDDESICKKKC